jgi:tetratricopeptide (TPR) repeat protein
MTSEKTRIIKEIKRESPDAFGLLVFCSYLNNKNLYEPLLKKYAGSGFRKAMAILSKHSLIKQNTISRPLQLAVRGLLNKEQQKEYLEKCLSVTANFLSGKSDVFIPFLAQNEGFILNLESIAEHAIGAKIYNNDLLVLYQRLIAYYLAGKKDYRTTKELISKVEGFRKRVSYEEPILKARFLVSKGLLLAWQNFDHEGCLKYLLDALKLLNKISPKLEEHLTLYNALAQLYNSLGENKKALVYSKLGLEMASKDNSLGNQDALYGILSLIYDEQGDFKLALDYAEKSMSKIANKSGKIIIGELPVYILKPAILIKLGKYGDAYKHLSKLYGASDKIFGKASHYNKARIYCYYAYALFKSKKALSVAKDLLIKSQAMFAKSLGKEANKKNRALGTSHKFLGEIYEEEKAYTKARLEYSKALELLLNSYNGKEQATDSLSDLYAKLAIINGKLKATATSQQYLDSHRKIFGPEHDRTIQIINYLVPPSKKTRTPRQ